MNLISYFTSKGCHFLRINLACLAPLLLIALLLIALPESAIAFQATGTQPASQTAQETTQWLTITPSDAQASFSMPTKPRYVQRVFAPVKGQPPIKVHLRQSVVNQGKITYLFVYNDLFQKPKDSKSQKKALDGMVRGSIVNVSGQIIDKVTALKYKQFPGRQFSYSYVQGENQFIVTSRVFLVGKRQYQITFLALKAEYDEKLAAKFLNSFSLVPPENDDPPVPRIKK